jgi:hypothetical protein
MFKPHKIKDSLGNLLLRNVSFGWVNEQRMGREQGIISRVFLIL